MIFIIFQSPLHSSAESFSEFPHAIFDTLANRVDGSSLKPKSTSKKDYMQATQPKQFENPKLWKAKGKSSYEKKEQKEILILLFKNKSSCSYFFSLTSRLPKSGNGHAPPATLKEPAVECTKLHPKTCPWWMFTHKHLSQSWIRCWKRDQVTSFSMHRRIFGQESPMQFTCVCLSLCMRRSVMVYEDLTLSDRSQLRLTPYPYPKHNFLWPNMAAWLEESKYSASHPHGQPHFELSRSA